MNYYHKKMKFLFNYIDTSIVIIYLIIVYGIGFYYSRKKIENTKDYFLAGQNLSWYAVGISIFATNISSEHFIGLAGAGSVRGIAVAHFELLAIFILIILGKFIVPVYYKSGILTTPEYLGKIFDNKIRYVFAFISIFMYLFTKAAVSLFAGGILFTKLFSINIYASAVIIVLLTGIYTVFGGSYSVIKTNIFQGLIMIIGATIFTIFGLNAVGGFPGLKANLPIDYFQILKPINDPDFPWTGILFGAPIIAFWYWITDQYIIQKVISAKNINEARKGTYLTGGLKILPLFILVIPGLIIAVLFPDGKGDAAFLTLVMSNIIPNGVKGLVIAGFLAAIMSSLASVINSISAILTNDFYKSKFHDATESNLVLVGRLSSILAIVFIILLIPFIKTMSNYLYIFLQSIQAFISAPIAAVFLISFGIKNKINSKSILYALIIGELFGILRMIIGFLPVDNIETNTILFWLSKINYLHFSIFLFCATIVIFFLLNYSFNLRKELILNNLSGQIKNGITGRTKINGRKGA